ncbi:serine/threonine-protein kinase [Microlunatus parietis]|uniref:non-specific serine/threonine protein kinase n=1 Tax=Microlunatus parietis TaxID=682979 RepID=A0A7Y9I2A9_9ACTN|nr:serine/threonine-protein kinase [Microlunatus parietis]NYE68817.1 serine/threonine-protein kinase [Microlunatus parietis]
MQFSEALGASYRLSDRIGTGAAGEVWRAIDTRTGETVAAKLLRPEHAADHAVVERFIRERSLLTGLRHPNIVAVRDLVVEGDRLAIVMDYLEGGSLRDLLADQRTLAPTVAVHFAASVLDGLAAAHQRQILHRDVKPDNVLLEGDWRTSRQDGVKVTDFGIAEMISEQPRTDSGGLLGTPEYMAPELVSTGEAGPPADVYGAGILFYELLAGRTPFAGPGTDFTIAQRHVTARIPALKLPAELWRLVRSLLDKNPRSRPTAAEAAAELRRLSGSVYVVPPLALVPLPQTFERADRPATAVRGVAEPTPDEVVQVRATRPSSGPAPDLGTPVQPTMHRPLPQRPVTPAEPERSGEPDPDRPWWKTPRVIIMAAGALVILIGAGVAAILLTRPQTAAPPPPSTAPPPPAMQASQQDQPTPTGLGISRRAEYDPATATIRLTITYSAQNSALRGPFLEVLPGLDPKAACPTVSWTGAKQAQNLPSVTGISQRCGWSVDGVNVPAQGSKEVSVAVRQPIADSAQLQTWLKTAAETTTAAVEDDEVTGTAYPVQRLRDIQLSTPSSTVSQQILPITLVPVWPSGTDKVNPLYRSPSVGAPSEMLVAIAGGEKGIRFSDGCSGAVSVSSDGLTVTALSQTPECTINAKVGNFSDLQSPPFAIVTRGG